MPKQNPSTSAPQSEPVTEPRSREPQQLREVAVTIAMAAASHVRRRRSEVFRSGAGAEESMADAVHTKSTPTDPVTIVDTETEELLRSMLESLRPEDDILGEEGGGTLSNTQGVRWVIDPIDGTVNFMYGIPAYSVSVAAQIDGVSVAGAVVDIERNLVYSAATGHGATVVAPGGITSKLSCSTVNETSLALLATGFGYASRRRTEQGRIIAILLPQVRDIRRIGSAALDLCMVASGQVDAHFEHGLSPWDWAAGSLIAAEAGAVVRLPAPDSTSGEGAVTFASAPGISAELMSILEATGADRPIPA